MKKLSMLTVFVGGVAAVALGTAVVAGAAGNPHPMYTCVKIKQNGESEVRVNVPEPSVAGHTNAGFTCVLNEDEADTENPGGEDPAGDHGNEGPGSGDEAGATSAPAGVPAEVPQEPRSLYCSTTMVQRANGDGVGIALNLLDSQGKLLVALGLVTPARFYAGLGASCDVLAGFTSSGTWVDNVGAVVPGVAVYPLYVPA